jgi:hypothetical protein
VLDVQNHLADDELLDKPGFFLFHYINNNKKDLARCVMVIRHHRNPYTIIYTSVIGIIILLLEF